VICAPADFEAVRKALEAAKLKAELADITMKPLNDTPLAGDDAARMQKLLDAFENLDDVQNVYTTAVIDS
jgi:transcriptional/translational regulatory protein YebC/TACO1